MGDRMARKYGDVIEIRDPVSLGMSDHAGILQAIYVKKHTVYNPRYCCTELKEKFLTGEELEGTVPLFITGHILYIRPVDKRLLTFENGIFVPYSECDDLYWLRDQEGIASSYFRTIYNDTPDIYIGDCVIERGTVNVFRIVGKNANQHQEHSYFLGIALNKNKDGICKSENEYLWFKEVRNDKVFKISRRIWD